MYRLRRRPGPVALIASLLIAGAWGAGAEDWPMFGRDARRSFAATEELPGPLQLRWTLRLPPPEPTWPDQARVKTDAVYRPIVVGGRVIVTSSRDDSVAAYDLADGREAWRFFTGGPVRYAPAAEAGRVFVGSDDGYLYALSVADGALLWKLKPAPRHRPVLGNQRVIDTWCVRGGPVVDGGRVYCAAGIWPFMGVFVVCADAATGRVVWCSSGDGSAFTKQPHSAMSFGGLAPQGPLAIAGDRLLVPNGRALPAALALATGQFEFLQLNNKAGGDRVSAGGDWFFSGTQGFDPETGLPASSVPGSPVVVGGDAFAVGNNEIRRFDPDDPKTTPQRLLDKSVRRRLSTKKTPMPGVRVIAAAGRTLYAGGDGWVSAVALPLTDGPARPDWTAKVEGAVADVVAAAGCLVVTTEQGAVHCLGTPGGGYALARGGAAAARAPGGPAQAQPDRAQASGIAAAGAVAGAEAERVRAMLADAGAAGRYAVVVGAGGEGTARALAAAGMHHVVVLEADAGRADLLRRQLHADGLYGRAISVVVGEGAGADGAGNGASDGASRATAGAVATRGGSARLGALPPYLASVLVAEDPSALAPSGAAAEAVYRVLHPYRGTAYLGGGPAWNAAVASVAAGADAARLQAGRFGGAVRLARRGGLSGAGSWTHENADAANTRVSPDTIVKTPLGVLWYGGSSNEGILPRHGHGPQPQVVGGRILILGMDLLRALDAYTGRVEWEARLPGVGSYYDHTAHTPGANGTNSAFVSTPETAYVAMKRQLLRLDMATGRQEGAFELPSLPGITPACLWSFVSVTGDVLIGGASPPNPGPGAGKVEKDPEERDDETHRPKAPAANVRTVGSTVLFVMDRKTGRVLWARAAAVGEFRHNAICAGGGRLYVIDRPIAGPPRLLDLMGDDEMGPPPRLLALDLMTGRELWTAGEGIFGTCLSYSARHDVVVESGRKTRDALRDEPSGMRGYNAATGGVRWHEPKARGPALVRGDALITEGGALDVLTGAPATARDPLTGYMEKWYWARNHGCNTPAGSTNLITFRSGAAGFYDLLRYGGTGNFGGFRSSCTNNLIVGDGLVCSPDYTRTCTCSYPLQTSLALVPDEDVEVWTFQAKGDVPRHHLRRVGVNFGAPGDRVDDGGTLWMEHPSSAGRSPKVDVTVDPEDATYFRRHASTVSGPLPWVAASGVAGARTVSVDLRGNDATPRRYTVRLVLAEPEGAAAAGGGAALMDVYLQGKRVEAAVDVARAAGGTRRSVVREYRGVQIGRKLVIELKPARGGRTVLCGVEAIEEVRPAAPARP